MGVCVCVCWAGLHSVRNVHMHNSMMLHYTPIAMHICLYNLKSGAKIRSWYNMRYQFIGICLLYDDYTKASFVAV